MAKTSESYPHFGGGGVFRPRCNEVGHCVMQWGGSPFRTKVNSDHTVIKVSRGQALIAAHYMFFVCFLCAMQWGGSAGSGGRNIRPILYTYIIYKGNGDGFWWKNPFFIPQIGKKCSKPSKSAQKWVILWPMRGVRGVKSGKIAIFPSFAPVHGSKLTQNG